MKKVFMEPEAELIFFELGDIVTASCPGDSGCSQGCNLQSTDDSCPEDW